VAGQQAELEWRDGVPVSTRFADPYYSLENGLAETRHVFLAGNGLPDRLRPGFHVAELGIGTGLNLLALLALVRATGRGPIRYTGFEAFPMSASDMRAALAAFAEVAADAERLVEAWIKGASFRTPEIEATFVFGDARQTLPRWPEKADAWFLDGFAPARNPELWEPALLAEVALHTAPGGTAATYSAAGEVRRSLAAAGFAVERRAGYGRKRHMTVAHLP
jgi:tRNA U34 5-methylaminomethyl-2-thiouridine-forming methyltransferase MnmC